MTNAGEITQTETTPAANSTRRPDVVELLLWSLEALAAAGQVDAACRIAGQACVALRTTDPRAGRRFDALLHRLSRRLAW
ncbi:MAG TPA: hypothetical protein VHA77_09525 [Xanthobacteraceae bacterium]|jgi:hypothetical protein|nr:hypothetical protein [Xanthobacteraceae bacterium]